MSIWEIPKPDGNFKYRIWQHINYLDKQYKIVKPYKKKWWYNIYDIISKEWTSYIGIRERNINNIQ